MNIGLCENKNTWDNAVNYLRGFIQQSWAWGEFRSTDGWTPWRVLAEEDGEPVAAVQVLQPKLPLPLLYAPRGIMHSRSKAGVLGDMAEWLRGFMRKRSATFIRMDPAIDFDDDVAVSELTNCGIRQLPDKWNWWGNLPRLFMVLDVSATLEQIYARMRKTHRYDISRAEDAGLSFTSDVDDASLAAFHVLLLKSAQRQGFAVRGLPYFHRYRESLLSNDRGRVFLAWHNGTPISGAIVGCFGHACNYLYGGFDWQHRKLQPNPALHWRVIQWAKSKGCTEYNMGGLATPYPLDEKHPGYGLYTFKKGFGADSHYYAGYFDLVGSRATYKILRPIELRVVPSILSSITQFNKWQQKLRASRRKSPEKSTQNGVA